MRYEAATAWPPLDTGYVSDTGGRESNEDYATVQWLLPASGSGIPICLLAVADGMGGHAAGEVASRVAVEAFVTAATALVNDTRGELPDLGAVTDLAFAEANAKVYEAAQSNPENAGMGTTLTTALIEDGRLCIGHVGDSRAYLVRGLNAQQLTRDHVGPRGALTQVVGFHPSVTPDVTYHSVQQGDALLLCSDGLHRSFWSAAGERRLAGAMRSSRDAQSACRRLIAAAKAHHHRPNQDNLTAVCMGLGRRAFRGRPERRRGGQRWLLAFLLAVVLAAIGLLSVAMVRHSRVLSAGAGPAGGGAVEVVLEVVREAPTSGLGREVRVTKCADGGRAASLSIGGQTRRVSGNAVCSLRLPRPIPVQRVAFQLTAPPAGAGATVTLNQTVSPRKPTVQVDWEPGEPMRSAANGRRGANRQSAAPVAEPKGKVAFHLAGGDQDDVPVTITFADIVESGNDGGAGAADAGGPSP